MALMGKHSVSTEPTGGNGPASKQVHHVDEPRAPARLLDVDHPELRRLIPLSRQGLYSAARQGLIPHVRCGRRIFFDKTQIEAWIAAGGTALPGGWRRKADTQPS